MKLTLREVIEKHNALQKVAQKALPARISYAIAKNIGILKTEVKLIEEGRVKLIEGYAEKDENGNPIIKDGSYQLGSNMASYAKEYEEYLKTETEIAMHQISESELDKLDDPRFDVLTAAELEKMDFIFSE